MVQSNYKQLVLLLTEAKLENKTSLKILLFGGDPEVHETANDYGKIYKHNSDLLKSCKL